jgi:hypothetical protein
MSDEPKVPGEEPKHGPAAGASLRSPSDAPDSPGDGSDDFIRTFSHDVVTSFIGEEGLPTGKKTSGRFWMQTARALYRLLTPRANQIGFTIGFWVLRAVGSVVLVSWLYFGLYDAFWDGAKLTAGLLLLCIGPLALRGIEFLLENIVLKGATRESWRHFWDFRRMMTPRSIQTGFFAGFWLLVFCGLLIVLSGFRDLVFQRQTGSFLDALSSASDSIVEANNLAKSLLDSSNPLSKYVRDKITPGLMKELQSADRRKPHSEAVLRDLSKEVKELKESDPVLQELSKRDETQPAAAPPVWNALALPKDLQKVLQTKTNPFKRIVMGFFLMLLGPMALRLLAECIILFFRINETLTDISKQLEIANRRAEREQRRE